MKIGEMRKIGLKRKGRRDLNRILRVRRDKDRFRLVILTGSESGIGSFPATSYTSQDLEIVLDKKFLSQEGQKLSVSASERFEREFFSIYKIINL